MKARSDLANPRVTRGLLRPSYGRAEVMAHETKIRGGGCPLCPRRQVVLLAARPFLAASVSRSAGNVPR
jgi:hypothetical protein